MQFEVYRNPDRSIIHIEPYVVALQHDHLDVIQTIVVAPMLVRSAGPALSRLTPVIEFEGLPFVLKTYDLVSYSRHLLKQPVGSIAGYRDSIIAAIDVLFTGV